MVKRSIHQKDIANINIYTPNNRAVEHVKKNLRVVKGEINKSTIIIKDTNTLFSTIYRTARQKISEDTEELKNTINQQDLNNVYKTFHPKHIFGSSANGTYAKRDNILGHKINFNTFKIIKIIQNMSSDHNKIKLEIKKRKLIGKSTNTRKLNNIQNNPWVKQGVSKRKKIH